MTDAMTERTDPPLLRLLDERFAGARPRRAVRATTRVLGWLARRLPPAPGTRALLDRTLAPLFAWSMHRLPGLFDMVRASDAGYWAAVEARLGRLTGRPATLAPFERAVYAWLGVEGAAMRYREHFHLPVVDDQRYVERLYLRDGGGGQPGGCPFGLRRPDDGFACRTIMMGSRHVFDRLEHARMKVDVGIPEMVAIERLVADHLAAHPGDGGAAVWDAIAVAVMDRFRASDPVEDDFFVGGELRPETRAVIDELIATMIAGRRPAIFCQFRLVPAGA